MKNIAKVLAAVMIISLIVSVFSIAPAALNSADWEVVHTPSGSPENAVIEKTAKDGIRLSHEGHYPSSNAGLLYTKPLSLTDGIKLNVTVETDATGSADAWYGIFLMNRPVYFDVGNRNADKGFGIVLLCRPGGQFQWVVLDDTGFNIKSTATGDDYNGDKEYYAENVEMEFRVQIVDGELLVFVDDQSNGFDFSDLLQYFDNNEAYIGFSMSQTELEHQSFVVNSLNDQLPASEGDAIPMEQGHEDDTTEAETEDNKHTGPSFTFLDFTNPDTLKSIVTANDCTYSYDEGEGALKIEVTGEDPYLNFSMKKADYFDGDDFCILKMEYKTDYEGTSEFFYTTKEVPSFELCNLQFDLEATEGQYKILEQDMQESANWTGQIRNFRFDPASPGEEGQVFFVKNISFEIWEDTGEDTTEKATDAVTSSEALTTDAATNEETTTKAPETKDAATTAGTSQQSGGPNVGLIIGIICGAVAVICIVVAVVIAMKKKKK